MNAARRHLNESQRAMAGAKMKEMFEEEARERQGTRTDIQANLPECDFGQSRDKAAKLVNVSPRSIESASKVPKEGTPTLVGKVQAGYIAVSTAAEIATLPDEEQEETIAKGEAEILRKAKEIRAKKKEGRRQERREGQGESSGENKPLLLHSA